MPTKSKKSKRKGGLAFACWALGFFIIVIIFLVKLDDIKSNLKQTNFFERLFHTTPTFIQNYEDKKPAQDEPLLAEETFVAAETAREPVTPVPALADDGPEAPVSPLPPSADALSSALLDQQAPAAASAAAEEPPERAPADDGFTGTDSPVPTAPAAAQAAGAQAQPAAAASAQQSIVTTSAKLYFVVIDGDGVVSRRQIARTIQKSDSPLTENIRQLLAGPSQAERNKGCRTLIPDGTRLLSASVRDGTATLSFSEEFEYNQSFGVEGYLGQLMQIVYTATEFSTVTSVQVLIDGQKKEYLGSEGVWIGSPLMRTSFK